MGLRYNPSFFDPLAGAGQAIKKSAMLLIPGATLVGYRARGLVGYDVALTRRRSPVRIRPGPLFKKCYFFAISASVIVNVRF
jgi:hypothetical protein